MAISSEPANGAGSPPSAVLEAWELGAGNIRAVEGGLNNRHWRVDSGRSPLALRRYGSDATRATVAYEHSWLGVLAEADLWAPVPLATTAGSTIVEAEGHLWAAFEWMSGSPPPRRDPVAAALAGEMLARAHRCSGETLTPRPGWGFLVEFAELPRWSGWTLRTALSLYAKVRPSQAEALSSVVEQVEAALEPFRSAGETKVVIVHYDLHPENLRVVNGRVGILDWDFAHPDARAVDLAIVLRNWPEGFDAFLAGYERVCQLSTQERAVLPLLAIARGLDHSPTG